MHGDQEWFKKRTTIIVSPFSEGKVGGSSGWMGWHFGYLNWASQPVLSRPSAGSLEPYSFFGCFQSFGLAKTCSSFLRSSGSTTVFFTKLSPSKVVNFAAAKTFAEELCVSRWFCMILLSSDTRFDLNHFDAGQSWLWIIQTNYPPWN